MEKNLPVFFAALLTLAGGLIIGKTLLAKKSAAPIVDMTCSNSQPLSLTDDVRAYIDHEFQSLAASPADGNEAAFTNQILDLERTLTNVSISYSSAKEFIGNVEQLTKKMAEWRESRDSRLSQDRAEFALELINAAAATCGIQRKAPPKSAAAPPQPPAAK